MHPIEHKLPSGTLLIVEVPSDYDARIVEDDVLIGTYRDTDGAVKKRYDELPSQGFELLGESTSLTAQQLSGIMTRESNPWSSMGSMDYKDFTKSDVFPMSAYLLPTALESFASLMKYLKLDESKRWIVLFKTS